MTDRRLRELERRARLGDVEARLALDAALGRLQADPALDALWVAIVDRLEAVNEDLEARLEVQDLARAVTAACEGEGWGRAQVDTDPDTFDAPVLEALVVCDGQDIIACVTRTGPNDPTFAVPGSLRGVRLRGRFGPPVLRHFERLTPDSSADDHVAWARQPDVVTFDVRIERDWYLLRAGDGFVPEPVEETFTLPPRLRTTLPLALAWAREALA